MVRKGIKLLSIILISIAIINIFYINCSKIYANNDGIKVAAQGDIDQDYDPDIGDYVYNITGGQGQGGDPLEDVNYWKPDDITGDEQFNEKLGIITGIVRYIGIFISVGTLSVIGIKFMLGSVEEKAQYKQTLMPWLIGAIILFAMSTLPSLIYKLVHGVFRTMI